jgi:hypothetical protein
VLVLRLADPRDVYRIVEALGLAADSVEDTRAPLAARFRAISHAIADGVDRVPDTAAELRGRALTVPVGDCVCGRPPVIVEAPAYVGAWLLIVDPDGAVRLERVATDIATPG